MNFGLGFEIGKIAGVSNQLHNPCRHPSLRPGEVGERGKDGFELLKHTQASS